MISSCTANRSIQSRSYRSAQIWAPVVASLPHRLAEADGEVQRRRFLSGASLQSCRFASEGSLEPAIRGLVDRDLVDDSLTQIVGEAGVIERNASVA
jgi:hypothetical protein